jgi:HNH endonuclease
MSKYIPENLRIQVAILAYFRCEYCHRHEGDSFIKFQIDHIISRKHGGLTILANLAYCCPICNNNKGSDIATILQDDTHLIRLFHPRKDTWSHHFEVLEEGVFMGKTDIGNATIKILDLNNVNRILERIDLISAGYSFN